MAELERFGIVLENLNRMEFIPRSPFVPKTLSEWLAYRVDLADIARLEEAKRLLDKQAASGAGNGNGKKRVRPAFGAKQFRDNRGPVLVLETIWSPWYMATDYFPQAPWPTPEEMKEEGDERNTSGFGRFLGLPRVPGNETVVWKQKNLIVAYPFDKVWELPKLDPDIPSYEESVMDDLVGEELLSLLDS